MYMTGCRLRDTFCDTEGLILKSVLFDFLFLIKYVSQLLRFFIFFTKSFFLPDFQEYLNLRVVNFSTLKLDEIKLFISTNFKK